MEPVGLQHHFAVQLCQTSLVGADGGASDAQQTAEVLQDWHILLTGRGASKERSRMSRGCAWHQLRSSTNLLSFPPLGANGLQGCAWRTISSVL